MSLYPPAMNLALMDLQMGISRTLVQLLRHIVSSHFPGDHVVFRWLTVEQYSAPADAAVNYVLKSFDVDSESAHFHGEPSPSVDKAWSNLLKRKPSGIASLHDQ